MLNVLVLLGNISFACEISCLAACTWLPSSLQGGNTVRQLLKIAKKTVPEDEWRKTPVVLKATAGLRLLPEEKAKALLKEVRRVFCCFFPSSALRQFGTDTTRPARERGWETTKCLQVSLQKKAASLCPFGGYHVAKKHLLWGCVE